MEHNSIAQDIQQMKNKAHIMGSLFHALQEQTGANSAPEQLQRDVHSLALLWAELEQCISEVSQEFAYVADLSRKNNVAELLWVLGR